VNQLLRPYAEAGRILSPSAAIFDRAGQVLRELRMRGREVRRASLVGDVLIALAARASGATLWTADAGAFEAIRAIEPFSLRLAATSPARSGEPPEERDGEQLRRGRDQHHRRRPRVRDAVPEVRDRHGYLNPWMPPTRSPIRGSPPGGALATGAPRGAAAPMARGPAARDRARLADHAGGGDRHPRRGGQPRLPRRHSGLQLALPGAGRPGRTRR